ncbi:MAG: carboxypeptidase-like regulatory domain-containing protein [Mariniphaga sp.]|nr:carboxypeptidase-like regulatory domain-containing protein [Mariniphaga sp.]MDD4226130.1 carboxypeptidase-like regulatory domain-containing protein [Mariniphaga sp.]MDD4425390.1 carboxypeptidase-like regulatory domain-containing protein [Mariniphaga sp.]
MKTLLIGFTIIFFAVAGLANEKEGKKPVNTGNTAAVALSGTITDSVSGELLVGVEVKIEGTDTKTYTDLDGNFLFSQVVPGEYKLVTNYISYKQNVETLKVNHTNNKVRIKLENSN